MIEDLLIVVTAKPISFIEHIILHFCKIPLTFSSVKERVIRIEFITRPKYAIVCTGSMTYDVPYLI